MCGLPRGPTGEVGRRLAGEIGGVLEGVQLGGPEVQIMRGELRRADAIGTDEGDDPGQFLDLVWLKIQILLGLK